MIWFPVFVTVVLSAVTDSKVYDRCQLARELKFVHETPGYELATWVCIAEHESQYNTSAVGRPNGDKSTDHGIFQINDRYWCSPPGKGHACGLPCSKLEDDDITDDYVCAQRIYKEHKHLSGDGFNAWAVYKPYCKGNKSDSYIKDCFNDGGQSKDFPAKISTQPVSSAFAHGFFGGVVGRDDEVFSTTEKSLFDPFYSPKTSQISVFTPTVSSSRFFVPTSSRTTVFSPSTPPPPVSFSNPTTNRLFFLNPTTSRPSTSVFNSPATYFPSRGSSFFAPTTRTTVFPSSSPGGFSNEPVFIVNGVKWFK